MRPPEGDEIELLKLMAVEGSLPHDDERLNRFSSDASTLSKPDTFNSSHDLGWLRSTFSEDDAWVHITDAGRAALPVDENGCHTIANGDCVSPGPCIHSAPAARAALEQG